MQRRSLCRGMGHPSERTAKRASPLVREQRRDVRASEYPGAGAFRVAQAFPEVEGRILPVPVQDVYKRQLLANATVITMNPTRDVLDTDILIENGAIADMGPGLAGRPENAGAERVDLSGRIVIPGLIQSHMHVTQSLFRGLADEMELMDWLRRRIWPLEGAHTPETLSLIHI